MADHRVLLQTDRFVLIKHLEDNKYSFGTIADYENYKNGPGFGGFPVSESFISAPEMMDRMKAWQEIDKKYADVNDTFATEQKVIDVLIRECEYSPDDYSSEYGNETDIVIDFNDAVSELKSKNVKICAVHSDVHPWGLCLEDKDKNLYQMKPYYSLSYLQRLIETGAVVCFHRVDAELGRNIGEWEKNYMDAMDVKAFIKKHCFLIRPALDDKIHAAEQTRAGQQVNKNSFEMQR